MTIVTNEEYLVSQFRVTDSGDFSFTQRLC